jgi:hypothetical protein
MNAAAAKLLTRVRHGATRGKREDAREFLAPVYGWFTDGFNTRDLKGVRVIHSCRSPFP